MLWSFSNFRNFLSSLSLRAQWLTAPRIVNPAHLTTLTRYHLSFGLTLWQTDNRLELMIETFQEAIDQLFQQFNDSQGRKSSKGGIAFCLYLALSWWGPLALALAFWMFAHNRWIFLCQVVSFRATAGSTCPLKISPSVSTDLTTTTTSSYQTCWPSWTSWRCLASFQRFSTGRCTS